MTREPTEQGRAEDWLSSVERLEAAAKCDSWSETATGVRLSTPIFLRGCERVSQALTRLQLEKMRNLTCAL